MLLASREDLLAEELKTLRRKVEEQERELYKTKMSEVMKVEVPPDTTYKEGIVIDCSTTKEGRILYITIMSLEGKVLVGETINPYSSGWEDVESGNHRLTREDIDAGIYPDEMYEDLKAIIDGTDCIIVYDRENIANAMIRWGLASSKGKEIDEYDIFAAYDGDYDNLDKIVDISQKFIGTYGETDVYGNLLHQSLYTCCQYYLGNTPENPIGDMYLSEHRCDAIRECYLEIEKRKKDKQKDCKAKIDGVVLSEITYCYKIKTPQYDG